MYPFKQFLSKDVIISPLTIFKEFSLTGDDFFFEEDGKTYTYVDFFKGKNLTSTEIIDNSINLTTGWTTDVTPSTYFTYKIGQVYNSIQQIYNTYKVTNSLQYIEYPDPLPDDIYVISISPQLYSLKIEPSSFVFTHDGNIYEDDGNGNIFKNDYDVVGNILYEFGLIILWDVNLSTDFTTINKNNFLVEFKSTFKLKEHQYKCVVRTFEFKHSLNPTLLNESENYKEFVDKPYFTPYVTTIGLYNENKELLAVAKLPQPTPTSRFMDTTFIIKFDE